MSIRLALSLLSAAATAPGQPVQLRVGDLDASRLKPYVSEWRVVEVSATGASRETQRSFDQLVKVRVNGRLAWRQHQYDMAAGQPGGSFDGLSEYRSFSPIEAIERGNEGAYRFLRYEPTVVHLECRRSRCPPDLRDGRVQRRDIATEVPTFDYWGGTYGLLLALVPLEPGKSYKLPVLHPAHGLIQLQVDVERKETIQVGDGAKIEAYRLRTPLTGWIYHVTREAPYWVRLEYSRPDGSRQITERLTVKPKDPRRLADAEIAVVARAAVFEPSRCGPIFRSG